MKSGAEIIALDPGRNLGVAHVTGSGELLSQGVLDLERLRGFELPEGTTILVGDGTGSAAVIGLLADRGVTPELVDERGTTLLARQLYWSHNPPRGLLRLLPVSLRPQPALLDGYAAWALALRWLGHEPAQ